MMIHRLIRILFIIFTGFFAAYSNAEEYCYAKDNDPYIQFSTKTAYELIRAKKTHSVPSCKPVMVWATLRHGTRYPGRKTIEEMKSLVEIKNQIIKNHDENKRGKLCIQDLQSLKNWTYMLSPNYDYRLSTQGKDDLRFLAKRLKSQFSNILDASYTSEKFAFYNDGTERTVESTLSFVEGLFGPDIPNVYENSSLLKPADSCSSWVKTVKNDSNLQKEYFLFRDSSYVRNMVAEVSYRLGYQNNLTLDTVILMYDICRFEKAWYIASRPPFCSVFSTENLKVIEYLEDIHYYYKYGYGVADMSKKLACPLISDMIKRFKDVAEGKNKSGNKPVGIFYFSHTALHIPSLVFLGIREDNEHLLHNNYESMSKREFMTSIVDPFSANLVAAFYKCSTGEENRVIFYLNEDIVRYPGCDAGLCSWKHVYERLRPDTESDSCNFEFCKASSSKFNFMSVQWALLLCVCYYVLS